MEDGLNYLDEKESQNTIDEVVSQVGLSHPITFDGYDVREQVRLKPYLNSTSPCLIKTLSSHFELPYKTREVKASLLSKPRNMVE